MEIVAENLPRAGSSFTCGDTIPFTVKWHMAQPLSTYTSPSVQVLFFVDRFRPVIESGSFGGGPGVFTKDGSTVTAQGEGQCTRPFSTTLLVVRLTTRIDCPNCPTLPPGTDLIANTVPWEKINAQQVLDFPLNWVP